MSKLTKAQQRYLERAVERSEHPSKKTGTWELIRGGRAEPALDTLERLGLIRVTVCPLRTSKYLKWFEIEATPAGRAALQDPQP